ncbi:hypothetical protein [Methylobacterium soli]|uniref:Uncharacterized protein n=1 Tax=Methylobacterium soli TaxID=553447 RepID=A0A6L3SZL9_9HYPH|nr:hypothetical protein [Methylobacterium soli]KAB1075925.1 hypothetical protein F6X53_24145 [Methylobacterium soli]GJE41864.1 hypothetical protein AEGHOMDF_1034 [Methylobacterium soli]
MTDYQLKAIANAGARGDMDEYHRLLGEQYANDWAPGQLNRAVETAERHGCVLERSADGLGDGPQNMGGIRIKERKSGRIVAGRQFEFKPSDVLEHFGEAP